MSLLIKALQKAEQSKSEATENAASVNSLSVKPDLELAPHTTATTPSLHEESGFDTPMSTREGAHTPRQAAAVFRAGEGGSADVGNRTVWLAGGGLLLLLLLAGGFYFYLQSLEQPQLVVARPSLPPPVTPKVEPVPIENVEYVPEESAKPVEQALPEKKPSQTNQPQTETPTKVEDALVTRTEDRPKAKPAEATLPKVTRNRSPVASVSDSVLAGYQAYVAGDDAAASQYYRQAAQQEPRNVDAWLGLGAVAQRQGKADEASAYYARVLELDPRNPVAQTGLAAVAAQSDPVTGESRLKNLLAQQPEAAFLHAALGNLYADQGQWPSAQQSYFQAVHFDPKNAEYAFNLAVSMDQMGKPDLALNYYQRSLELLPRQGGPVDRAQVEVRIAQLRQASNK